MDDKEKILQKLEEVAADLESDMAENGWTGRTVALKFKLDTYQGNVGIISSCLVLTISKVFTRAKSFNRNIMTKEELFAV